MGPRGYEYLCNDIFTAKAALLLYSGKPAWMGLACVRLCESSVVGLLSAQVYILGAHIRCAWRGSGKWLRVLFCDSGIL